MNFTENINELEKNPQFSFLNLTNPFYDYEKGYGTIVLVGTVKNSILTS